MTGNGAYAGNYFGREAWVRGVPEGSLNREERRIADSIQPCVGSGPSSQQQAAVSTP